VNHELEKPKAVCHVLCGLFSIAIRPVSAQRPAAETIGATHGQIAGVAAGIAGAGALIGIGIYAAVKHNHTVTGCTRSGPDGLTLMNEPDKQTIVLIGEVSARDSKLLSDVSGKRHRNRFAEELSGRGPGPDIGTNCLDQASDLGIPEVHLPTEFDFASLCDLSYAPIEEARIDVQDGGNAWQRSGYSCRMPETGRN
jgi:hypothetical protein